MLRGVDASLGRSRPAPRGPPAGIRLSESRARLALCLQSPGWTPCDQALATEILQNTRAVSHLIREGRIEMLYNAMEVGRESGMQTMNQALRGLVDRGDVDPAEAARYVSLFESGGWGVVASPRPAMPRSEPRPAPEAAARAGRA